MVDFFDLFCADENKVSALLFDTDVEKLALTGLLFERVSFSQN